MRIILIIMPLLEAGVVLFLVLRKPSGTRPTTPLTIFGLLAIGAGILWIPSQQAFGWLGPFWFIRVWGGAFAHPGDTNFWGLLNPLMYRGVFALGLIAAGAGLLRVRSWARTLFLYLGVVGAILAMITLVKFGSRMPANLKIFTFLHIIAALGIVLCFMQESIARQFQKKGDQPDSSQIAK